MATAIASQPRTRGRHIPGEAGTWVFIFGDLCVFAVFFTAFLLARADDPQLFATSQATLNQDLAVVNTVFLLVSSLFVVFAVRAARQRRGNLASRFIVGGWLCGACFLGVKVVEYQDKIAHDLIPTTNDFYLYYYLLTGLHAVHVIVGMAVLTALWVLLRKPAVTRNQWAFIEGGACFWHMVDLLWIVLFPLIFLVH